jgi:hypothetical protein
VCGTAREELSKARVRTAVSRQVHSLARTQAGSERIEKSEVTGEQLREAQAINKSLSALGDVISALQRRTPHVSCKFHVNDKAGPDLAHA